MSDLAAISRAENKVYSDFANNSSRNTFARNLAQRRGSRQFADFRQGFQRSIPSFTAQFGRRGFGAGITGGPMRRAMNNYVTDFTRDYGRMQEDYFDQDRQFELNQSDYIAQKDSALGQLAAERARLIASTAQHISALKPMIGG